MLGEAGVRYLALSATPLSLRPARLLRFVRTFRASVREARAVMQRENAGHIVALGGFVAAPVVKAAQSMGLPILLVNLDAPPGKANRWMARRCDRVVSAIDLPMLPDFASQVVGLPVRSRALAPASQRECRLRLGLDPDRPLLLITGASQGATSINALAMRLASHHPALLDGWQILHLSGHGVDGPLRQAYGDAAIHATVLPFLHEMGLAWGAADLAISRAGANSVAEVVCNAVPTLFLPYPHHKDMHQKNNAQALVDAGAAAMETDLIDPAANAAALTPTLQSLMRDGARRQTMRDALRSRTVPDAALAIARMLAPFAARTSLGH